MTKCPKCGCQCEDGVKFCDECGAPIPQEKECPKCHAHIGLNAKFCDECGFSFENVGTKQATIAMGDKNVIAGDVVAHKESYDIKGDATIVRNEDESKKMVQCSDCGKNIPVSLSFECPSCHRIVCEECFDKDARKCKKCCGAKSSAGEEAYRTAILEALADGKIDVSDRKRLMMLQKQLGLSAARAIQIEKEVKSVSSTTGESKNTATLDKVNAEKAYELLYVKGDYKKAAELLAPIRERNPNDENILSLYLAALTKFNPVKAREVVEDLHADVLSGALTLIDIDMKRKDLASVEKRLAAAFAVWPDSVLLKCRKAVYAYEMFKATEDSAPLMEAAEILESIVDCKDAVEKSWRFFAKRLIDSALGDSLEPITANDCLSRGLLWDVVSQNADKSNALYRIVDLSDGPSAKFYPTYYMDTESIFDWPDEFKTNLLALRRIDPGRFVMGKGPRAVEDDIDSNPHPAHIVTLTHAYYIGVYTVTQRQWELVTGNRPSQFSKDECYAMRPVENIEYEDLRGKGVGVKWPVSQGVDSNSFIGVLRKKTNIQNFDLPTEAQWEYACKAGTDTDFNDGQDIPEDIGIAIENVSKIARCAVGVDVGTAIVGSYKPNRWGIYDMHGNVAEFCIDANQPDICTLPCDMPQVDPVGFAGNQNETVEDVGHECLRGGDWRTTEPEKLTSWAKSYGCSGVRLVITFNGKNPKIEKWSSASDAEIKSIPKDVYDRINDLSVKGSLSARLIIARTLYLGTSFQESQKECAIRMCKDMANIGYSPAQTFLATLDLNADKMASAIDYLREAAKGGDAKGFALLKTALRGTPEFNNKISEYLHSLDMDYVCVDEKLKRMIPKFKTLAKTYFDVDEDVFPKNILGAFASEEFLGESENEGNDSFVMFADDGIYLIHGWGWSRFNQILTWDDVAKHGDVVKHYSTIQLSSSPFAMTWGEWQNDEDAEVFAKIVAIAKKFYRPSLQKKTCNDTTARNDGEQKHSCSITISGGEMGVYRREYEDQAELDECLDCARNWDHAGGEGTHGFLLDSSGVHVKVTDNKGGVVFEADIKDDDFDGLKMHIGSKGAFFDESDSATNDKKFYYSCIEWYRYEWTAKLELDAPFDPQKLSLFCHSYVDASGEERNFIGEESAEYDGQLITSIAKSIDEEPGGDDEMDVWTLVGGARTSLYIYGEDEDDENEDEGTEEENKESDCDGESDDEEESDNEEENIEEEDEESDEDDATVEVESLCKQLLDIKNEGIHKDQITAKMVAIIKAAADKGDGLAAYVMGELCLDGLELNGETVVEEDPDKMLEYLRVGADAGNSYAQSKYGQQLCNGVDGSSDHEDGDDAAGFPWIVKSGENGNVFALHRMTNAYIDGSYGQEIDLKKALECFKKINETKDSAEWPNEMIERAKGYLKFLPSIIAGDASAMHSLGEWLKSREGDWDYTWGYGDADSESAFWVDMAKKDKGGKEADDLPSFEDNDSSRECEGVARKSDSISDRKRIVFLLLGVFLGFVGFHFKYARRKLPFHLTRLALVGFIVCMCMKHEGIGGVFSLVWLILWFGGAIFVKKDGSKKVMKWV